MSQKIRREFTTEDEIFSSSWPSIDIVMNEINASRASGLVSYERKEFQFIILVFSMYEELLAKVSA